MWPVLGILTAAILIALYEVPSLIKNKLTKELWVFFILLVFGVVLSIINSLNINIPNPADWLTVIYKPVSKLILDIFK